MFFKNGNKTENQLKGLYAGIDELISQRRYLPYIRQRHNSVTSYQAGDIRSAFKGRGMELEEVRAYGYGDDVRDIDWRVTARKGDTYTKIFSEEKDREVYAVLDVSPYMLFGTRKELKSVSAAKIAALLGWQSLANKDRFGALLFNGKETRVFKPQNNQKGLMAVFKAIETAGLDALSSAKKDNGNKIAENKGLAEPLSFLQYNLKSRAMIFIISDFNNIDDEAKKVLAALSRNSRVYCINVYDLIEEIAPEKGEYLAQYDGEKLIFNTSPQNFRETYAKYFAAQRKEMENFCKRFDCYFLNIRTDRPLYKQLKIL